MQHEIELLGMSPRTTNSLINNNIRSVATLRSLTPRDIELLPGLGDKAMEEIQITLKKLDEAKDINPLSSPDIELRNATLTVVATDGTIMVLDYDMKHYQHKVDLIADIVKDLAQKMERQNAA